MELTEELELMAESESARRRRVRSKSSFTLALLGWLIVGSALNSIIFASFPLRIATAVWQLNLIGSILSSSFNILIGSTLIIVAQLFNSRERTLQKWQLLVSRFAAWLAVLMLVIIPLQFILGLRALNQQTIPAAQAIAKLKDIAKGINNVNSEPELRAYVASLPNPPALPSKFDAAFPVIKERAIQNINAQINATANNAELQKSQALQVFLKEAVRNTAQAILMATAFSVLANLSGRASNIVTRFIYSLV
ncbi:MAG: hypothetical protein ACK535_10220 [Cyanobacteriota bacterium]|jgi:hypothetical protein